MKHMLLLLPQSVYSTKRASGMKHFSSLSGMTQVQAAQAAAVLQESSIQGTGMSQDFSEITNSRQELKGSSKIAAGTIFYPQAWHLLQEKASTLRCC
eukprot:1161490-Pelagomonas_calceolata.AAC.4